MRPHGELLSSAAESMQRVRSSTDAGSDVDMEPRPVRAPRGTARRAGAGRRRPRCACCMNNLDPEVAERPEDLVVYGGTGRAARDWRASTRSCARCARWRDDETLLVQSGKPVGVLRTHELAPRVLIANSNLVPRWATWPEFRGSRHLGLTMYGQMTAGSWIYIGTQGILQGTYETFAAVADQHFGGTLAGTMACSPPGSAAWAARNRSPSR